MFGARYEWCSNGSMRNARLQLSDLLQVDRGLSGACQHCCFSTRVQRSAWRCFVAHIKLGRKNVYPMPEGIEEGPIADWDELVDLNRTNSRNRNQAAGPGVGPGGKYGSNPKVL